MGTRGLMGIRSDSKDHFQYVHFDCYPSGLGANLVKEIKTMVKNLPRWKELANKLKDIEPKSKPTDKEIKRLSKYANTGVSTGDLTEWYVLLRNLQGELKKTLRSGYIEHKPEWIADSLYCEYGYIVNLDENTFEVYVGFQHEKDKNPQNRYRDMPLAKYSSDSIYYPCKLVATFKLDSIPKDWDRIAFPPDKEDEDV